MQSVGTRQFPSTGQVLRTLPIGLWILLCALGSPEALCAQVGSDTPDRERVTLEELQETKTRITENADGGVEEAVRTAALRHLDPAIESLREAAKAALDTAELERETNEVPQRIEALTRELALPFTDPEVDAERIGSLSATLLETEIERLRAELKLARAEQGRLDKERTDREERRGKIATELAEISQEQVSIEDTIAATALEGDVGVVEVAARWEALARRQLLETKTALLQAERVSLEARRTLLPLRIQRSARRVARLESQVAKLDEALTEKKKQNAQAQELEATQKRATLEAIIAQYPQIGLVADENALLSAQLTGERGLLARVERMKDAQKRTRRATEETRLAFRSVVEDVKWIGLSDRVGQNLREEWSELPNRGQLGRDIEVIGIEYGETQYDLKEMEEQFRAATADTQVRLAELFPDLADNVSSNAEADARNEASLLLETQRELLGELVAVLRDLSTAQREQIEALADRQEVTRVFRSYIEERVLWVASVLTPRGEMVSALREAVVWGFGGVEASLDDAAVRDGAADDPALGPSEGAAAEGREGFGEWSKALGRSFDNLLDHWLLSLLASLAIVLLFIARPLLVKKSAFFAERVRHHSTDSLQYTWGEIAITVGLALPIPALVLGVGVILSGALGQVLVATAVGQACIEIAGAIFVVQLLFQTLRPKGLAEGHFRWPTKTVTVIRRKLRTWMAIIVPALFVVLVYVHAGIQSYSDTVGRLAFGFLVTASTIFTWRTLRPHGPALGTYIDRNPTSLIYRLRVLWFPLIAFGPASLGVAAAAGYYYTALRLGSSTLATVAYVLALIFVHAFLLRWLFAARRRLAVDVVRARAKAKAEEEASESAPAEGGESADDEEEIDIPSLDAQTKQIFRAGLAVALGIGLYVIWADKLPALHVLERIEIYPSVRWVPTDLAESSAIEEYRAVLDGTNASAAGGETETSSDSSGARGATEATGAESGSASGAPSSPVMTSPLTPPAGGSSEGSASGTGPSGKGDPGAELTENVISLADLGLAILILFFMIVASRNLPGLMEFSILQRLPLDRGARYAISTIVRYLIVIVGTTVAFSAIGIGWARLQWLAAAFTFGLAFGLQEIFANFVSGLIILIERPVRVGDVVTVAGIEGRVTRLQMRSTTIQDWERREFLVPNKEFITGSLLNWTLSDPVSRIVITVGVAYGSDVRLAEKLLLETARDNKLVLTDPAPNVVFRQFGESTLDFELRLFIAHREQWAAVTNQANFAIDAAFREANIEIAFPQRDLHIRSGLPASGEPVPAAEPTPPESS